MWLNFCNIAAKPANSNSMRFKISLVLLLATTMIAPGQSRLKYTLDLNDRKDDLFHVTLDVSTLSDADSVYQFAATAPGTYQVMDIGRFVRSFKALDKKGKEIETRKVSENRYRITNPKSVRKIVYSIAETWDTPVKRDGIYKMCGSSIENDHVLINWQCVVGYPITLQSEPVEVALQYPSSWAIGTALHQNKDHNYVAENFDRLVDSPALLGNLTVASTKLGTVPVEIFTYSKTGLIKSSDLLKSMESMLKAADAFLGGLPVDRYTFLFHFEDLSAGAWEHSYSSEYVMSEKTYDEDYAAGIKSIAAHEFFHVVTPLNIHSTIIEPFNFVTPVPSEHLWLYEGTTEWASDMMQLRYGLMDLKTYMGELSNKLVTDSKYDTTYSLLKLALTSYTDEGQLQYPNIYMRGAVVAGLLDIRLLELSHGKQGLRDVIRELAKLYGPHRAFPEKDFFSIFVAMTHPEIADFFDRYIKNAEHLPVEEYYSKLGIKYQRQVRTGQMISTLGATFIAPSGKIEVTGLRPELLDLGLKDRDEVEAINGIAVSTQNASVVLKELRQQPAGTPYTITVKRSEGSVIIKASILSKELTRDFVFEEDPNATPEQLELRKAWMTNH